jgi:hypothetical protein
MIRVQHPSLLAKFKKVLLKTVKIREGKGGNKMNTIIVFLFGFIFGGAVYSVWDRVRENWREKN